MLITLCILPLVVLSILAVVFGKDFMSTSLENIEFPSELGENLSSIIKPLRSDTGIFNIDPIAGAIAIIIVIAIAGTIVGIRVLGSGLADTSIRTVTISIAFTGVWLVLSLLSSPLLFSIEVFGSLIYVSLTIGYVIGVIQQITG